MGYKKWKTAIVTLSDKGYRGEREDLSAPAIRELLPDGEYEVAATVLLPDERELIERELVRLCDEEGMDLILTTGGTGFAPRDCTPEATLAVATRQAPGIAEAMRYGSLQVTPRAMLSRGVSVIRGRTLIINLPGSPKAVRENLGFVLPALSHGLGILTGRDFECAAPAKGEVLAVCISPEKGTQKKNVGEGNFIEEFGIEGDAHAGKWHRQVSLLSHDRIEEFRRRGAKVEHGAFGENLVVAGYDFKSLPVGTRFACGDVVLEMTQIGKECHHGCTIFQQMGECIMPREGVFARVLHGGRIKVGDVLKLLPAEDGQ